MTISRILVANRGEIAVRIIRACQSLGIQTVVAVSEADRESLAAKMADRSVCIGPSHPTHSYLRIDALISATMGTGCDALHPGYGFLAEAPELAKACEEHGIIFIGPGSDIIRRMGNKCQAKEMAHRLGIPTVPGSKLVKSFEQAATAAKEIGLPILLKAAAGGGGRGIKIIRDGKAIRGLYETASAEARGAFGDDSLYLERYISNARHVEVQILGDRFGNIVHLGDRDCSLQRRYQKVIEEAPATLVREKVREDLHAAAVTLATKVGYQSAGTVEFLIDQDDGRFYFLEMNTRIQVEHPVTEMITDIDLVQEQIQVADGHPLSFTQGDVRFRGHAVECRVNAESPTNGFRPCPGSIIEWDPPRGPGIRVDTHCYPGYVMPPFYDSLLAKVISWGSDRREALSRMHDALQRFRVKGIDTNIAFLAFLLGESDYKSGKTNTRWLEEQEATFVTRTILPEVEQKQT